MSDLGIQGKRDERVPDAALPFRFEVSWRSLTHGAEPSPAPMSKTSDGSIATGTHPSEFLKEQRSVLPIANSRYTIELSPVEPVRHLVEAPDAGMAANCTELSPVEPVPHLLEPPDSGIAANRTSSPKWGILVICGLLSALALIAAVTIGRRSSSHEANPTLTTEMGGAGWLTEWVSDKRGLALGRQISLYRPSLGMSDYRLEFIGRINRNSFGWVFRVEDMKNYYVGKVSESAGRFTLTRFAVIRGVERSRSRIILPLLATAGAVKVRLDARRSRFTIYLQNEVVDDWQDDRLMTGGVGFLNESNEQGQVDSVQISILKGLSDK